MLVLQLDVYGTIGEFLSHSYSSVSVLCYSLRGYGSACGNVAAWDTTCFAVWAVAEQAGNGSSYPEGMAIKWEG